MSCTWLSTNRNKQLIAASRFNWKQHVNIILNSWNKWVNSDRFATFILHRFLKKKRKYFHSCQIKFQFVFKCSPCRFDLRIQLLSIYPLFFCCEKKTWKPNVMKPTNRLFYRIIDKIFVEAKIWLKFVGYSNEQKIAVGRCTLWVWEKSSKYFVH